MKTPTMDRAYDRIDKARRNARKIIDGLERGELPHGYSDLAMAEACAALYYRWKDAREGYGVITERHELQTALIGVTGLIEYGKPEAALRLAQNALQRSLDEGKARASESSGGA